MEVQAPPNLPQATHPLWLTSSPLHLQKKKQDPICSPVREEQPLLRKTLELILNKPGHTGDWFRLFVILALETDHVKSPAYVYGGYLFNR
ncbi:hypothetical protein YC2023_107092 [Brassica napus]